MRRFLIPAALLSVLAACGDPVPRLPGTTAQEQILWAAKYSDARALRYVLQLGAAPDTRDPNNNWTPVMWASVRGCAECIDILARGGADLEARGRLRQTSLILATRWDQEESVRALLDHGADPRAHEPDGWTALIWAAFLGREKVARDLLEHGAPVEQAAGDGLTPLMAAARRDHEAVVDLLLEHGADPSRTGPARMTAADLAASAGHADLAARLRKGR
jgi:ankyrin repeat protein